MRCYKTWQARVEHFAEQLHCSSAGTLVEQIAANPRQCWVFRGTPRGTVAKRSGKCSTPPLGGGTRNTGPEVKWNRHRFAALFERRSAYVRNRARRHTRHGCRSWPAGSQSSRWFPNVGTIRRTSWGCGDRGDYPVREVTALAARRAGACSPPRRGRSSSTAAAGGGTAAHFSSDFENRAPSIETLRTQFVFPARPLRGRWGRFPELGLPACHPAPIARLQARNSDLRSAAYRNGCAWPRYWPMTLVDWGKPDE